MLVAAWICAWGGPAHALDPDKRLTQYLHALWRIQDASAPAAMFTVTQSSNGFIWLSMSSGLVYRFDGVRFVPVSVAPKGGWTNEAFEGFGARDGSVWAIGDRGVTHSRNGAVTSEFQVEGLRSLQNVSEAPDGSLWIVRAAANVADAAAARRRGRCDAHGTVRTNSSASRASSIQSRSAAACTASHSLIGRPLPA